MEQVLQVGEDAQQHGHLVCLFALLRALEHVHEVFLAQAEQQAVRLRHYRRRPRHLLRQRDVSEAVALLTQNYRAQLAHLFAEVQDPLRRRQRRLLQIHALRQVWRVGA